MLTIKEINKFIYLNCRVKHKADMIIAVFIAVKSTVREDLKNPGLNKNEDLYIDFHLLMVIINSLINWPIALIAQLVENCTCIEEDRVKIAFRPNFSGLPSLLLE